jgi:toxin ParE1/3/4
VDSRAYAKTVVKRIVDATRSLSKFPQMGRMVPEFADETIREVFAYSYRIIYKVYDDRIVIAAVVHGKRLL